MAFKPKFKVVETIQDVALLINDPHVDVTTGEGKALVAQTEYLLSILCDFPKMIEDNGFTRHDAMSIHQNLFYGKEKFRPGHWRDTPAHVFNRDSGEKFEFAPPFEISPLMSNLMPVKKTDDLVEWYTKFQTIHPFTDGNGRVGGIIVAVLHKLNAGE